MNFERRKQAFIKLGDKLKQELTAVGNNDTGSGKDSALKANIEQAHYHNPWFIPSHVKYALNAIADSLAKEQLNKWLDSYPLVNQYAGSKTIAVIMAGNVPAVGFHDFLCVLLSGNHFLGKLSSQDQVLLPILADMLIEIEPGFSSAISFENGIIKDFDAVIATGSDNTARYFEYYFAKYPHIIRKSRNDIAVLNGDENSEQLSALGKDIFLYFGLGCRNVSKVYLPNGYRAEELTVHFDSWAYVKEHHKYMNNYDYFKSIYLINRETFTDNGFLLMKEDLRTASPVSVLFFETYSNAEKLYDRLASEAEKIQCVVTENKGDINNLSKTEFGKAQQPSLWDYADDIDTLKFLISLRGLNKT